MTLLKFIFFPVFMGLWVFRLPWVIYIACAAAAGYFAYLEYETYRFNVFEAEFHVSGGIPEPSPLSKWNRYNDTNIYGELNVQGLYFTELAEGTFDPIGLEQGYILLADDQGREIKAALVARPDDLPAVRGMLSSQGRGETIEVTVNGILVTNADWIGALSEALDRMNIPYAAEFVVIEPIIGDREGFIYQRAEDTIAVPAILAALAGVLGFYGIIRFFFNRGKSRRAAAIHAKNRERATKQSKRPSQKIVPARKTAAASPWGTFKPVADKTAMPPPVPASEKPEGWPRKAASQAPEQSDIKAPQTPAKKGETSPEVAKVPEFVSVFPGGGSGFKFKTADQIIRQTFGTFSGTTDPKPRD